MSQYKRIQSNSYVYIAECNGNYKFGVSTLPEQRLQLIRTDNALPVRTVGIVEVHNDAYLVEGKLHEILKQVGTHIRGEWFKIVEMADDELLGFVLSVDDDLSTHIPLDWHVEVIKAIEERI